MKDENYVYSLSKLKVVDVKDWSKEDVELTVTLLLNLIKPFLNVR